MLPQSTHPVEVFYSYAHEDEELCDELRKHLANLKRQGIITEWYDRDISAGAEWGEEIKSHLNSASVILLLISPDFMNSDYSNDIEVKRAMERHERGEARVIPIILRPVDWEGAPFSKLQGLPTDAKAVTLWQNHDEAFVSVVNGIRRALKAPAMRFPNVVSQINAPRPPRVGFVARRDSEGRDIVERLTADLGPGKNQLIALSGPGGVGKTTLAAEVARALSEVFARRTVWIGADGRDDFGVSTLINEIASQLGHAELRSLAPQPKAEQVQALIALTSMLIVLDNFETIAPVEQTRCVEFLLNRAPCPAVITTRQRIPSAHSISISAMSAEEADDFLERLINQASDPNAFAQLDRERIIRASERNPFVLQWVVAQIDLAQEAQTVLDDLARGDGDAAQRVFDRTFGLNQLGDDGRATLLALSLFAPDASRTALGEVAGFASDMNRLNEAVSRLASLWLAKTAPGGSRLTVEGLTRELAKARFRTDAHTDEIRRRFVRSFLSFTKEHSKVIPEDFAALGVEKDNALGAANLAFELEDWDAVMQFGDSLYSFLFNSGCLDEAMWLCERARVAAHRANDKLNVARFTARTARILMARGQYDEARRIYDQLLHRFKEMGSDIDIARTLRFVGGMAHDQGQIAEARRLYRESLKIETKIDNKGGIGRCLESLAHIARDQGKLSSARRLYTESLEIFENLGDHICVADILQSLASMAKDRGEEKEARRLYNEVLEIYQQLKNPGNIAAVLHGLAMMAQDHGDTAEAQALYDKSLEISRKLDDPHAVANTLHELGRLAHKQGDFIKARGLYDESLEMSKKLGLLVTHASTLFQLGLLAQNTGNLLETRRLYNQSLEICKQLGYQKLLAVNLYQLGRIASMEGDDAEAARLCNESLAIDKKMGNQGGIALSLHQLAILAHSNGKLEEARRLYNESLEINKRLDNQDRVAGNLHQLGRLAEDEGDAAEAAQLFREALVIFEKLKSPSAEMARRSLERVKRESS